MIWRCKPIPRQFDLQQDFGLKDLIVGGCSFSDNNRDDCAVTWPYYLRDLGGFDRVLDTSMPGAGNFHIMSSLIWALENEPVDRTSSLIIVMWSGNDRDDAILPCEVMRQYPYSFRFHDSVFTAVTGGQVPGAYGNGPGQLFELGESKNKHSRSIENYIYVVALWHYLTSKNYRFIFLDYMDRTLPKRSHDFDIREHLSSTRVQQLDNMLAPLTTVYEFSLRNNLMAGDDYHPNPDGHLEWTRQILVPYLQHLNICESLT